MKQPFPLMSRSVIITTRIYIKIEQLATNSSESIIFVVFGKIDHFITLFVI